MTIAKRMLHDREALDHALTSSTGKIQGTLKIASSINFADYELPALLKSFREQYPDVHIQVKTTFSHQVVKMFNTDDCMVALHAVDMKYQAIQNCYWKNRIAWYIKS